MARARRGLAASAAASLSIVAPHAPAAAPGSKSAPCSEPEYRRLDFWIGEAMQRSVRSSAGPAR